MSYYREQYELSREIARERLETCEVLGEISIASRIRYSLYSEKTDV